MSRDGGGGHKKPSGISGWLGPSPEGLQYRRLDLPKTKAELEATVVEVVTSSEAFANKEIPWPGRPVQAEENSFDFVFPEAPGTFLELMEIAQFDGPGGFARVSLRRNAYDFVWNIWQALSEKAMGYGDVGRSKLHLLLYSTDSAFHLLPGEEVGVAYCLSRVERGFRTVTYTHVTGGPSVLFPRPTAEFEGFSLQRLRNFEAIGADLSTMIKTGPNSGKVEARARRGDPPKPSV